MRDFIRSPLQFVRPMTAPEWDQMLLRASKREAHRKRKQRARQNAAPVAIAKRALALIRAAQATDSSGVF
jgi:hypothetical protein